jgi:hypothetical protein
MKSSASRSNLAKQPASKQTKDEKKADVDKTSSLSTSGDVPKAKGSVNSVQSQLKQKPRASSDATGQGTKVAAPAPSTQSNSGAIFAAKSVSSSATMKQSVAGSSGGSGSGGLVPPVSVKKEQDSDLQQRWREKLAAASEVKKSELPALPFFQATSLPSLPSLPPLPSLAPAKPKPSVVVEAKPATPKVAPPSPVYPYAHAFFCAHATFDCSSFCCRYVCGPPFRESNDAEESDADLVTGESIESLLTQVHFALCFAIYRIHSGPLTAAALGDISFGLQFFGPLDQRRSAKGEKLLVSKTDWKKHSSCLPEWPPKSFAQWKAENSAARPPPRRDAIDIAQLRVELVAISNSR